MLAANPPLEPEPEQPFGRPQKSAIKCSRKAGIDPCPGVAKMFEGFTRTEIDTSGARIALRHGGDGPPLLLLHGNPLTHASWSKVAPDLAKRFHVVAADLRGYGDSVGPEDGGE